MMHILLGLLLLVPPGSARPTREERAAQAAAATAAKAQAEKDVVTRQWVADARASSEVNPLEEVALMRWLGSLQGTLEGDNVARGVVVWETDGAPAVAAAEKAAAVSKYRTADLLGRAANLALGFGRFDEFVALSERSLLAGPTRDALGPYVTYWKEKDPTQLPAKCKIALKAANKDVQQRYDVFGACEWASDAETLAAALSWASKEDRAWYAEQLEKHHVSQQAHQAEREARSAASAAAFAKSAGEPASSGGSAASSGGASSGSGSTSITANISCGQNVRVYHGSTTGSGTYGWEAPNHVVKYQLRSTEQLCVCDSKDKRISCWTPSGQAQIDLDIGCGGITE